ncbi:Hypothetical predicted protein [Podarcis lilfordi]|uniref:Uncharacterized protein n=1 Tax=Podarcis lilfordi TaxID=74358 RepID=A0AA35L359_9SAUR|nr:Hypothetical predicted protein [Podarcis lilfordi]
MAEEPRKLRRRSARSPRFPGDRRSPCAQRVAFPIPEQLRETCSARSLAPEEALPPEKEREARGAAVAAAAAAPPVPLAQLLARSSSSSANPVAALSGIFIEEDARPRLACPSYLSRGLRAGNGDPDPAGSLKVERLSHRGGKATAAAGPLRPWARCRFLGVFFF